MKRERQSASSTILLVALGPNEFMILMISLTMIRPIQLVSSHANHAFTSRSSSPPSSPDMEDAEVSKRKKNRANRFHETLREVKDSGKMIASTLNVYQNADGEEDFDWSQFHIVGTCQDMTKRYLRLTSVSLKYFFSTLMTSYSGSILENLKCGGVVDLFVSTSEKKT